MSTARWRCSKRDCKATLQTTKGFSSLIGENLPDHNHINNLLKRAANETEASVLTKFAKAQGTRPTQVIQEIYLYTVVKATNCSVLTPFTVVYIF